LSCFWLLYFLFALFLVYLFLLDFCSVNSFPFALVFG
jgi:hypothetical protein